jgi:tRNA pseudouridine55 synthase
MTISFQPEFSFVNLNKPTGMTSFDCIRRLRRILRIKKMGHLGTLDPPASGVLPVAVGMATRLIPFLENSGKIYKSSFMLGVSTSTDDLEGEILNRHDVDSYNPEALKQALSSFVGEIMQTPPAVSAVKIDGRRAYDIAFSGGTPDIKSRRAFVRSIEMDGYNHPRIHLTLDVGPGTYIRSIARDLGKILGCGGAVETLVRVKDGNFLLEDSVTFEQIEEAVENQKLQDVLIPAVVVMKDFPVIGISGINREKVRNGNPVKIEELSGYPDLTASDYAFLCDESGKPIALAAIDKENNLLVMQRVFN